MFSRYFFIFQSFATLFAQTNWAAKLPGLIEFFNEFLISFQWLGSRLQIDFNIDMKLDYASSKPVGESVSYIIILILYFSEDRIAKF